MFGHMTSSVTVIANNYRMHVARRRRREMVQLMFQAGTARYLQSVYRGHLGQALSPPSLSLSLSVSHLSLALALALALALSVYRGHLGPRQLPAVYSIYLLY
jgi:hypothetical protein